MIYRKNETNGYDGALFAGHQHLFYISKKRPLEVYQRLSELNIGDVGMSLITFGELRFGAQKSQHKEIALENDLLVENWVNSV